MTANKRTSKATKLAAEQAESTLSLPIGDLLEKRLHPQPSDSLNYQEPLNLGREAKGITESMLETVKSFKRSTSTTSDLASSGRKLADLTVNLACSCRIVVEKIDISDNVDQPKYLYYVKSDQDSHQPVWQPSDREFLS